MKSFCFLKQRNGPLFQGVVGLMIGITVELGFVRASPQCLAQTSAGDLAGPLVPSDAPATSSAKTRGWLEAAVDADFTDRFIQKALVEIGPGVSNAFAFVRDRIGYEAYPGSLRGARGTLWSEAGNSLDKASLLIALLRAQGIGAQYARGTLSTNDARIIIASMFDPVVAANAVGYIPERYPRYDPSVDPGLLRWVSDHWWVELTNGTALDPSFKNAAVGAVRGVKTTNCFEVPDEMRHKVIVRLKAEFYAMLPGLTETTPLEATFSTVEIYGKALTLGHFINTYQPPALIGGLKTYTYSPYLMLDDNDAELGDNHLIRGADFQEVFSSLLAIANTTLTRLTLELEARDPGKAPDIRTRDLLDRVGFAARHGLGASLAIDASRPAFTENDLTTILVTPGFVQTEMVTTYQDALKAMSPEIEALAAKLGPLTNTPTASLTAQNRADLARYGSLNRWSMIAGGSVVAGAFLLDSDIYTRQMRRAHRTLAYYDSPRFTLFEARVAGADTNAVFRLGLDLRRNVILAVPYPDQSAFNFFAFNLAKGRVDGILEHLTVQDFLGETNAPGPASPITIFQAARSQGISMVALDGEADIPGRLESLPISAEAKARIGVALRSGKQVNVPARMVEVNGAPSIGWWEIDAQTGETVAVSENGGNQEATEFVLISALVFLATALAIAIFGRQIAQCFGPTSAVRNRSINPGVVISADMEKYNQNSTKADKITLSKIQNSQQNADGSVSFEVSGQTVTLSANQVQITSVTDAIGSSGSVVDFVGTDVEVIFTYSPGTNGLSGPVVSGSGLQLETVSDRAFVVKAGEGQIPSAFRARVTNTGATSANFELSGTPPVGWNLLFAGTNSAIPTNATSEVSVFLQPQPGAPMPMPGADIAFDLAVARSGNPVTTVTQTVHFVMPIVQGMVFTSYPEILNTSPNGSVTNTLYLLNTGNVTQSINLALTVPTNFLTSGLASPVVLAPGQSATQALRFLAQGIAADTDFDATVTAVFGGDNQLQKQTQIRLHVAAPGALQALNAANDARALKRDALAATLEALGRDLSQLYKNPASEAFKSRVVAGLATLAQQLEDPLLAPFSEAITASRNAILAGTPATLPADLETLGSALAAVAGRLSVLADHDFELSLQPNSEQALPETPTKFGLCLKNKGSQTTTYNLSLSSLPAGVTGGLSTNRLTLPPGGEASPTLSGAARVWVTLTQPASQLTAFEFTVSASAETGEEVTRSAVGAFTAREELVQVVGVEADPPFVSAPEAQTEIGLFTGGDAGEGLDLDGKFIYAVNFGGSEVGQIRDAFFTDDTIPGLSVRSQYTHGAFTHPDFGPGTNDDRLEEVMLSIRYGIYWNSVDVDAGNLKVGQAYKLQLLFMDPAGNSYFDVLVGGEALVSGLCPGVFAGKSYDKAVVLTHRFVATNSVLNIVMGQGSGPIINGLTLEEEEMPVAQVTARVFNAANAVRDALASYTVTDASNVTMYASLPIPIRLNVLTSLDTFNLGAMDAAGWAPGLYTITVSLTEMDGTPIPGALGHGTLLVGLPVSAEISARPTKLPAGDGKVDVTLNLDSQGGLGLHGLTLLGIVDTPGDALTVSVRDHYAYVSGSTTNTVVDISDPRNPIMVGGFGAGQHSTIHGDYLLVANGFASATGFELAVYNLTNPAQPALISSVQGGVSGIYPVQIESCGNFGLIHTLVFGWDGWGTPLFNRGDVFAFDLSNPASPRIRGLVFNDAVGYPQNPGSDYFIGQKSDHKDGILFLPSTTVPITANGGTGRLRLVDARGTNRPAWIGDLLVPGTVVLESIAVQGDRALVVGSTTPFSGGSAFNLTGPATLTLLDVRNAATPSILGSMGQITNVDALHYANVQTFPGTNGFYLVGNLARAGKPLLILVDANDPANLATHVMEVPAAVMGAVMVGNLIYMVSSSGLAIYDSGRMLGLPVTAQVRIPKGGRDAIVPGSFSIEPDEIIAGMESDTLVWHRTLTWEVPDQEITWQSGVTNLQPGETRLVSLGGTVDFTAWGIHSSLQLAPLTVSGQQVLSLTPGFQTVRPGETAAYTLMVTNSSAAARNFTLNLQGVPGNWVSLAASLSVPAQSQAETPLVLRSDTAAAVSDYGFIVSGQVVGGTANMVGGVLTLSGSPVVSDRSYGALVSLSPSQATAGQGTPAQYTVRLINTGNTTDHYALSAGLPAGFTAQFSSAKVEVTPGLDNYREVSCAVTPPPGTAPENVPFTITATSTTQPSVQHQTSGTVSVVNLGVGLSFAPAIGPPNSTFHLTVTNTGQQTQSFDLVLGGAAAPLAALSVPSLSLAPGAWQTMPVTVSNLNYGHPGDLSLIALATARANTNVQARATASVRVPVTYGVSATFEPSRVGLPGPGQGYALLMVRNTGNTEAALTARIAGTSGPLTAGLHGPTNQLVQQTGTLRLPGLASGAILLQANMTQAGTGAVHAVVFSLEHSNVTASAMVTFKSGVWLAMGPELIAELSFAPVPGVDYFLEHRPGIAPNDTEWTQLPGGPYNRGWYYLSLPANCAAFPPDPTDTNRLFLECADQPMRVYRLRTDGAATPPLHLRLMNVQALKFDPVPGFDHVVQWTDKLGPDAQWFSLPRSPHNHGLAFDLQTEGQRFYRVLILTP